MSFHGHRYQVHHRGGVEGPAGTANAVPLFTVVRVAVPLFKAGRTGVTANLAPPLCGTPVPNTLVYLERGDQILWGIMEPPLAPPRLFCTPYSFRSSLCICACKRVSRSCYTVSVDRQVQTSYTQYDADSLRQRAAQHHLGGSCSVTESEPMSDGRA